MEMKKQKLLLMLDSSPATPDVPAGGEVSAATPLDEQDEVTGMKCRGPLKEVHRSLILRGVAWVWLISLAVLGWGELSQCHHPLYGSIQSRSWGP